MTNLRDVEQKAIDKYDGNLTLMRFPDGWRAMYGSTDSGDIGPYDLWDLPFCDTLEEALEGIDSQQEVLEEEMERLHHHNNHYHHDNR
jgi:hypothetical protein